MEHRPRRVDRSSSGADGYVDPTDRSRRTTSTRIVPPVLARQLRNGLAESEHRGHIVEVDSSGRIIRALGDPDRQVLVRSCVKPFGLIALIEAGAVDAFDLTGPELAILASSHSGEDVHVRTLQAMYRRAGVTQTLLACGSEGMPLDALTAARLARDGERPSPVRHMCSGQHSIGILLSRLRGWPLESYWHDDHPAQIEYRHAVARAFGVAPAQLPTAIDGCGLPTYGLPLRAIAQAYAMLAEPDAIPASDPRRALAPALRLVRDSMLEHPEMVAGTRDRLDSSLMKAAPGRLVSKSGLEGLRGLAILRGARAGSGPTGMAIKIDDGGGHHRAGWAVAVEALAQAGVLDGQSLRVLGRYHLPVSLDPHGRVAAETQPSFDLAPVGELIG